MMHFLHYRAQHMQQPPASDLWAWFDFSQTGDVTTQTGGRIAAVADRSGNGRQLTSAGAARPFYNTRTINGLNVAEFHGAEHLWFGVGDVLGHSPLTIACVFVNDSVGQGVLMAGRSTVGPYALRLMSHPGSENVAFGVIHNTNLGQAVLNGAKVTTPSYGGLVRSGASVYGFCNGATGTSGVAANFTAVGQMTMGGWTDGSVWNFMLDGVVGEMLIYTRAFSGVELEELTGYLKAKWGL